jgi:hypothetical protein
VEAVTVVAGFGPVAGAPTLSPVIVQVTVGTVPTVVDVLLAVIVTEIGGVTGVVVVLVGQGVSVVLFGEANASSSIGPIGSFGQPGPAHIAVFATLVVPLFTVTEKVTATEVSIGTLNRSHVRLLPDCMKLHVAGAMLDGVGHPGVPESVVPVGTVSVMATLPDPVADAEFVAFRVYMIGVAVSPA